MWSGSGYLIWRKETCKRRNKCNRTHNIRYKWDHSSWFICEFSSWGFLGLWTFFSCYSLYLPSLSLSYPSLDFSVSSSTSFLFPILSSVIPIYFSFCHLLLFYMYFSAISLFFFFLDIMQTIFLTLFLFISYPFVLPCLIILIFLLFYFFLLSLPHLYLLPSLLFSLSISLSISYIVTSILH